MSVAVDQVAYAFLALGLLSASYLVYQMLIRPPKMAVMRVVWPLCALFAGPLLIWFYHRYGLKDSSDVPFAASVAKGALHCGAGCTLADLISETLAYQVPAVLSWFGLGSLFSTALFAQWTMDFVFALLIGIVMQYFAIAPMLDLSLVKGLVTATKADVWSLSSWQLGMYGFMGLCHFVLFPLFFSVPVDAGSPVFWVAMQVAMIAGFMTAYLPNWILIRKGIKEQM